MHKVLRGFISNLNSVKGVLLVAAFTLACGGGDYEEYNDSHNIFVQKTMGPTRFEPFFFNPGGDYGYSGKDDTEEEHTANINEWKKTFNDKTTTPEIASVIYANNDSMWMNTPATIAARDKYYTDNSFYQLLKSKDNSQALDYIAFAKMCEPQVTSKGVEWYESMDGKDLSAMAPLIEMGKAKMKAASSDFIKLRYAYQIVRLANYSNQFDSCIDYYNKYVEPNKSKSVIRYWALSLKARALYKVHRWNEAQYCYAMVFDRCTTRRKTARQGFRWALAYGRPYNEGDENAVKDLQTENGSLKFCKDKQERMPVLAMLIIQNESYPEVGKLDSMYTIDPKSEMLEWLMVRGVREMENDILPSKRRIYEGQYYQEGLPTNTDNSSAQRFMEFVEKGAVKGNTFQPAVWDFATAYGYFALGNFPKTKGYIKKLKDNKSITPLMADQVRVMEDLMSIYEAKEVTSALESKLITELQWLNTYTGSMNREDAKSMIWLAMSNAYDDEYKKVLSQALSHKGFREWDLNERAIDQLLQFINKPNKTSFEQLMGTGFPANTLLGIKGTIQLSEHRFKEAAETFAASGLPIDFISDRYPDPFTAHIKDCFDCDDGGSTAKQYNIRAFADRMSELKKLADHPGPTQARSAFMLANGMYNMTYFGNRRDMIDGLGKGYSHTYDSPPHTPTQFYNCEPAKKYYQMALQLAGTDREFAAECQFMVAKCELNNYYERGNKWHNGDYFEQREDSVGMNDVLSGNLWFPSFDKYNDTKYYKDVVGECGYFYTYAQRVHPDMPTLPEKK